MKSEAEKQEHKLLCQLGSMVWVTILTCTRDS